MSCMAVNLHRGMGNKRNAKGMSLTFCHQIKTSSGCLGRRDSSQLKLLSCFLSSESLN